MAIFCDLLLVFNLPKRRGQNWPLNGVRKISRNRIQSLLVLARKKLAVVYLLNGHDLLNHTSIFYSNLALRPRVERKVIPLTVPRLIYIFLSFCYRYDHQKYFSIQVQSVSLFCIICLMVNTPRPFDTLWSGNFMNLWAGRQSCPDGEQPAFCLSQSNCKSRQLGR